MATEESKATQKEALNLHVFMVATNKYLNYWKNTALSLNNAISPHINVSLSLFTDDPKTARDFADTTLSKIALITHKIPNFGWPDATLMRYRWISAAIEDVPQNAICMYLDSDMFVKSDFSEFLNPKVWKSGIALVQHPGYARRSGLRGMLDCNRPWVLVNQIKKMCFIPYGPWEVSRKSLAFVPNKKKKMYVHGAVWFGIKESYFRMVSELANRVDRDLSNGVIATWHDESHLNWFSSYYDVTVLDSRFSYFAPYRRWLPRNYFIETVANLEKTR